MQDVGDNSAIIKIRKQCVIEKVAGGFPGAACKSHWMQLLNWHFVCRYIAEQVKEVIEHRTNKAGGPPETCTHTSNPGLTCGCFSDERSSLRVANVRLIVFHSIRTRAHTHTRRRVFYIETTLEEISFL